MSADMGQFDARKTTPSSKEAQDQVFAKFKQRRTYQMTDKYIAEAHLTDRDKEVVLRFTNLTIGEAKAFMKIFDKFDHVLSNVELNLHMWEKQ